MNNNLITSENIQKMRFIIDERFTKESLNLKDITLFAKQNAPRNTIPFNHAKNPYIDNELRGYVQYCVLYKKQTALTVCNTISIINYQIIPFIEEYYPYINSFSELGPEYENIFIKFCLKTQLPLTANHYYISSNNTIKKMPYRSRYRTRITIIHKFIQDIIENIENKNIPWKKQDKWKVNKLPLTNNDKALLNKKTINFTPYTHSWLKEKIKEYLYTRIQQGESLTTINNHINNTKQLNNYLLKENLTDMKNFSHKDTLKYIETINQNVPSSTYIQRHLYELRNFCNWGSLMYPEEFPNKEIVKKSDIPKNVLKEPAIYSPAELERLNKLLPELPQIAARATILMEYCGLRFSDLQTTPIMINDQLCIEETKEHKYIFQYYMRKTRRYNRQPVSNEIAELIMEQIHYSKKKYGEDCKFLFAEGKNSGYRRTTYTSATKKITAKFKPLSDSGQPLTFTTVKFRHTYATRLANKGVDAETIRAMLGQKSIDVQMKHYVTIHSSTMAKHLKPILEQDDNIIRNIGKISESMITLTDNFNDFIPLPNGACSYKGKCKHLNACYSCPFYRPLAEYLPVYELQLANIETAMKEAQKNKHTKFYQKTKSLYNALTSIIKKLKDTP